MDGVMRRIDEIVEDMETAFGLPSESLFFDSGPRGSDGWVCVPAEIAEQLITFANHYVRQESDG
jgi:hypothetical protein